jgi:hypothetical protein
MADSLTADCGNGTMKALSLNDGRNRVRRASRPVFRPAEHSANWNVRDDVGRRVAPGICLYRLRAPGIARMKRVVVIE